MDYKNKSNSEIEQWRKETLEENARQNKKIKDWFSKNKNSALKLYGLIIFFTFFGSSLGKVGAILSFISALILVSSIPISIALFQNNVLDDIMKKIEKDNNKNKKMREKNIKQFSVDKEWEKWENGQMVKNKETTINIDLRYSKFWDYVKNSKEEWKMKFYILVVVGIILFVYFNFYK